MKCIITSRNLLVIEETEGLELEIIQALLLWPSYGNLPPKSLLFQDKNTNKWFTSSRLLPLLKQRINIEILKDLPITCPRKLTNTVNPNCLDMIKLRDFQIFAATKAIERMRGAIVSPTASGKGEIILAIISTLLDMNYIRKALIILPNTYLAQGMYDRYIKRCLPNNIVGISGTEKFQDKQVIFSVDDTVYMAMKQKEPWIDEVNVTIFDEFHHLSSDTWTKIFKYLDRDIILGFSGSLFKDDKILASKAQEEGPITKYYEDARVYALLGKPIFQVSIDYLKSLGFIADAYGVMVNISGNGDKHRFRYDKLYKKYITENTERNNKIVWFANEFHKLNLQIVIVVKNISHGRHLLSMLDKEDALFVKGSSEAFVHYNNEEIKIHMNSDKLTNGVTKGIYNIVIVNVIGDEGLDMPTLDGVIIAAAGRSSIKVKQRLGRSLRKKAKESNRAFVIDFHDKGHVFFTAQSRARKSIYESQGVTMLKNYHELFNLMESDNEA
jgi:superfamily II DNA or RNA helicase